MRILNKTVSFLAILSALPAAYAITARPGMLTAGTSRMPTVASSLAKSGTSGVSTYTTTATASSLLDNMECIEEYSSCIRGSNACGTNFEECTTKVLFRAKMAQCITTLAQCNSSGITSLFGVGNWAGINDGATVDSVTKEITDYKYPTDGSIVGQMIISGAQENRLDTASCVKKYTNCLKKDSVCGENFELCTDETAFKKQRPLCESVLSRCGADGKRELFGTDTIVSRTPPKTDSRLDTLIKEGADLAAANAVSTCYKVVDSCIMGACTKNPLRCLVGSDAALATVVDGIEKGDTSVSTAADLSAALSSSDVSKFIRSACQDTIGSNKYCHMTVNGKMPTAANLLDEDERDEIFGDLYASRMNATMQSKLQDLMKTFDTTAKQKCTDTIKSCVMRTCGGGRGSVCYSKVFRGNEKSINNKDVYEEIRIGCSAIVNTDLYCQYAARNGDNAYGDYTYSYINNDAFETLFPRYESGAIMSATNIGSSASKNDPIGVVGLLNAALQTNYSDAALDAMKKQCANQAKSCVKSMCGSDYDKCYRRRNDIMSDLTKTGDAKLDKSMNRVGGVLDYTVVLGLCLDTVKNATTCEEHLAIESAKVAASMDNNKVSAWGDATTVRAGWIAGGSATQVEASDGVQDTDENGNKLCRDNCGNVGVCNDQSSDSCGWFSSENPVMVSEQTYIQTSAATTLFKELVYDLEKEAQAKYNAKLTHEQNVCFNNNSGGIMGRDDMGSNYAWVKLRGNKVPKSYAVSGLKENQFVASNDLYGSFCRARVTVHSDNKDIQDVIDKGSNNWATTYFAVGDTITCGSWIPQSALEEIAKNVAVKASGGRVEFDKKGFKLNENNRDNKRLIGWMTTVGVIGGGVGGGFLGDAIANGKVMGGLTGIDSNNVVEKRLNNLEMCASSFGSFDETNWHTLRTVKNLGNQAVTYAKAAVNAGQNSKLTKHSDLSTDMMNVSRAIAEYNTAINLAQDAYKEADCKEDESCFNDNSAVDAVDKAADAAAKLAEQCKTAYNTLDKKSGGMERKNARITGATIGSALLSVGGGFLANQITKDALGAKLEGEAKEAYDQFMAEIGSHITCYVGGDEAATYGDTFSIEVE